jgi:hypothetical protein
MRAQRGLLYTLTPHAALPGGASPRNCRNPNRHNSRVELGVTHSKQTTAALSNRHKFGGTLSQPVQPPPGSNARVLFDSCTLLVVLLEGFGGNWRLASCIKYLCGYRRGHEGRGLRVRERAQKKVLIIRPNVGSEKSRRGVLTRPLCAWDLSICVARADKGEEA